MIFTCPRSGETIDFTGMHPATMEMITNSLLNPHCKADMPLIVADWLDRIYAASPQHAERCRHYRRIAGRLRDIAPAYAKEMPHAHPLG